MIQWTNITFTLEVNLSLAKRLRDTVVKHFDYPEDKEIDEFCKIAYKAIGDLVLRLNSQLSEKL